MSCLRLNATREVVVEVKQNLVVERVEHRPRHHHESSSSITTTHHHHHHHHQNNEQPSNTTPDPPPIFITRDRDDRVRGRT